jgi:hypothetical protein
VVSGAAGLSGERETAPRPQRLPRRQTDFVVVAVAPAQ